MQAFVNGLRVGEFEIPALVGVALLGIVLNLLLNWGEIVKAVRPNPAPANQPAAQQAVS